ncbi:MAG: DNA polymerase-3 subunit beta [Myxococcota bacterium]|jgi:DNA polymerase-3 subunit beta
MDAPEEKVMDLYIDRTELIRGLARVQGVVERRTTNLALAHVMLSAQGDTLNMTATDTMLTLVAGYKARIQAEGELSVDAQSFFQIARSLPEPTVHLQSIAGNRLQVRCGNAQFQVVGMGAESFPPQPASTEKSSLSIDGNTLRRIIEETSFSVCTDDNRYGINGAHMEEVKTSDGSRLRVVTTDGSRLSYSETPFEGEFGMGRRMLLPRKALSEIRKLIDNDKGIWHVVFGDRSATLKTDDLTLMIRLVDGEFPDYRRVLPDNSQRRVTVSREHFTNALKRVAIVASDRNHSVRFAFESDRMVLSARNVDLGEAREEVPIELSGEPMVTGFNVKYFQDILSATKSDQMILRLGDALDPCIIEMPDRDDSLFVVMPMRLD